MWRAVCLIRNKHKCNFPSQEVCPGRNGLVVRRQQLVAQIPQRHLIDNCPQPTPQPPEHKDARIPCPGWEWPRPTPNLLGGAIQPPIHNVPSANVCVNNWMMSYPPAKMTQCSIDASWHPENSWSGGTNSSWQATHQMVVSITTTKLL